MEEIAKQIVDITSKITNNYDAVERTTDVLKKYFDEKAIKP